MNDVISLSAATVVVCAALYLLALGGTALARPGIARRFLGGFATTPRLHYIELALRILVGAALVVNAPRMAFSTAIVGFGWILVATSLGLALVPWRLHQRFAAWSVPQATQYMPLIGVGALIGGGALIAALVLPRAAS